MAMACSADEHVETATARQRLAAANQHAAAGLLHTHTPAGRWPLLLLGCCLPHGWVLVSCWRSGESTVCGRQRLDHVGVRVVRGYRPPRAGVGRWRCQQPRRKINHTTSCNVGVACTYARRCGRQFVSVTIHAERWFARPASSTLHTHPTTTPSKCQGQHSSC